MLTRLAWLRWPAAIVLLIALAWHDGIADSLGLIERAGPALLWIVPFHALPLLLDARAWQLLLSGRISLPVLWWIAVVREAIGRLLPVLGIGAEVMGVRLAAKYLDTSTVSASVVVEALITMAVQVALTALGLALLFAHAAQASALTKTIAVALALSLPLAACAFLVASRGDAFHRVQKAAQRWIGDGLDGRRIDEAVRALLRSKSLCLHAFAWQFGGYVLGSVEVSWALDALGHPSGIAACVCIEALTQAARNAVFIAPAGLGVQEGAIVAVAALFGIDRDAALSLALVRRGREFVWGGIALASMKLAETRYRRPST